MIISLPIILILTLIEVVILSYGNYLAPHTAVWDTLYVCIAMFVGSGLASLYYRGRQG